MPEVRIKQGANSIEQLRQGVPEEVSIVECGVESISEEYVKLAHQMGFEVIARCHDNDERQYRKALSLDVEHLNVDYPREFMAFLKENLT